MSTERRNRHFGFGEMAARRREASAAAGRATAGEGEFAPVEDEELEFARHEAEMRKQFEPVAPWNRKDIPDYGPLDDRHNLLIFLVVGIVATIIYETTRCAPAPATALSLSI